MTLGPDLAARVACTVMGLAQGPVINLLLIWGRPYHAIDVGLLLRQICGMATLLRDPKGRAPWSQATGIALCVSGMMITAFAIRTPEAAPWRSPWERSWRRE